MNKKDYIDAINEIKIDEKLKKEVLNKMKEKKKNYLSIIYKLTAAVAMVLIVCGLAVMPKTTKNKETKTGYKGKEVEQTELAKIGDFKNFYKIVKDSENNYSRGYYWDIMVLEESVDSTKSVIQNSTTVEGGASTDYSTTNIQVEGVDEADIVKTDGEYIYYISNEKIVIVDAKDPKDLKKVSEIKLKDIDLQEIFINKNKLVVIAQEYYGGYDYTSYYSTKRYTIAKIYNIENKEEPKLDREVKISGYYLSARMIGDNVYLVANEYVPTYNIYGKDIEDLKEDDYKPSYMDTATNDEMKCIDYDSIYYCPECEEYSYLNIAGFNLNNNKKANIESYLGAGSTIYASEKNLYVVSSKWTYSYTMIDRIYGGGSSDVTTQIYKFNLDDSKVAYECKGEVPGTVLNQFSMDETGGYFRIATTDYNTKSTNGLYVLNENLETVGKVEDLAKGEKIYSVRFMGDRAYVVTFVQVDPLFAIDLSEPTNPVVLGELKIPGYSDYLHPYDENHIIGFGEDTEYNGSWTTTTGMKMALFDVTDPTKPEELYSVKIGDKGTYSELLDNHKALLFSKEKNIIAFPIKITKETSDYYYNTQLKFQGAIVYGLNLEKGFELKGKIAHMEIEDGYRDYDSEKAVERIIYIDDTLYTLSQGIIKATNMKTMEKIGEVEL